MKKRKIILIFCVIVCLTYFIINFKYLDSVTKIENYKNLDIERFVTDYAKEFVLWIKSGKEDEAYAKLYSSKFTSAEQLKKYFFDGILVKESLMNASKIEKISKDEYKVVMHISPPLFTDIKTIEENVAYQEKDIEFIVKLDGIFNYYICIN